MTEATTSADEPTLVQKLAAEAIGTFILVFIGVGSVVALAANAAHQHAGSFQLDRIAVAFAFGIAVVMGAYAFGRISGGHFNPAVTIGAAVAGQKAWMEAAFYIAAQFVGALIGSVVLFVLALSSGYNSWSDGGLGANGFGDGHGVNIVGAIIVELVLTFIFVFIILGITDNRAGKNVGFAPLAIGLALTGIHIVGIPLTGTSVNPARSFGPALFSGGTAIWQMVIFVVVTAIGGAVAGIVYPLLFGKDGSEVEGAGLGFGRPTGVAALPAGLPPAEQGFQSWQQPGSAGAGSAGGAAAAPAASDQQHAAAAPAPAAADPAAAGGADSGDRTIVSGGQQAWQQPAKPAAEGELPVYEQDGWRWDYAKQEWVPIEQH